MVETNPFAFSRLVTASTANALWLGILVLGDRPWIAYIVDVAKGGGVPFHSILFRSRRLRFNYASVHFGWDVAVNGCMLLDPHSRFDSHSFSKDME